MWRFPALSSFLGRIGLVLAHDTLINGLASERVEFEEERSWYTLKGANAFIPAGGGVWGDDGGYDR